MKEDYHSLPHISQSSLKCFMKSPADYHWQYVLGNRSEASTSSMSLGSLVHCMLLEPNEVEKRYFRLDEQQKPEPDKTFASTKNKQWRDTMTAYALAAGQQVVTPAVWQQADAMVQQVCAHPLAVSYLFPDDDWIIHKELDVIWRNECSDLQLKSKMDCLLIDVPNAKAIIIDYKTTSASNLLEFGWSVKKYGYDIQAAFYEDAAYEFLKDAYPGVDFSIQTLFIQQRTAAPYQVLGVVQLDYATVQAARLKYTKALQELEGCLHTGIWEQELGIQVLNLSGTDIHLPELNLEDTTLPWM